MSDCKVEWQRTDDGILMHVRGILSEKFDPSDVPIQEATQEKKLRVNLGGVTRLNSTGVREWLRFVRELKIDTFVLEECTVPFVQQIGMIFNMAPPSSVLSIYLPFFCQACNHSVSVLAATQAARDVATTPDRCPKCGGDMEFDELPEVYLDWIGAS